MKPELERGCEHAVVHREVDGQDLEAADLLPRLDLAIDVVDGNSLFGDDDVVAWIDLKIGTELIIKMSSERAKQELKQS